MSSSQPRPSRMVRMVDVYRHGQPRTSAPAFRITHDEARWWLDNGAALLDEAPGSMGDRGRVLVLSAVTSGRLQQSSPLGASLIFRYLNGDAEAIATIHAFAPAGRLRAAS